MENKCIESIVIDARKGDTLFRSVCVIGQQSLDSIMDVQVTIGRIVHRKYVNESRRILFDVFLGYPNVVFTVFFLARSIRRDGNTILSKEEKYIFNQAKK